MTFMKATRYYNNMNTSCPHDECSVRLHYVSVVCILFYIEDDHFLQAKDDRYLLLIFKLTYHT